jgi:hypothetical protein
MSTPFKLISPITVDFDAQATFPANAPALTLVNCSLTDPSEGIAETKKYVPSSERWILSAIYINGTPSTDLYLSIKINGVEQPLNLKLSETNIQLFNPTKLPQVFQLNPNDNFVICARNVSAVGSGGATQAFKVRIVRMPVR